MDTEKLNELRQIIEDSDNIVFFGGAGVSTESGIPDFRSVDGLYNQKYKYPPETIISHSFYRRNPEEFYRFYKDKMIFADAKPNKAHIKLAELEKQGKLKAVITQNIDGLHQMAGSRNVIELHGSVHRNYCEKCHAFYDLDYIVNSDGVPKCEKCGGTVKPDVVLYEEALDEDNMSRAPVYIRGGYDDNRWYIACCVSGSRTYQIFQGAETGGYKYVPDTVGQQCRSSDSG